MKSTLNRYGSHLLLAALLGLLASGVVAPGTTVAASPQKNTDAVSPSADGANRLTREGLVVDFAIVPVDRPAAGGTGLMQGEYAKVSFRITDAVNRQPVSGLYPAAWIDMSKAWQGRQQTGAMGCKDRVGMYLMGTVGMRPLIDLNSYFVLVMNQDATISVVDPLVGLVGITQLYAMIRLKEPGADWAKTGDDKRLFVTMPRANEVAVVDTNTFKVLENLGAGTHPMRIAMQPDEQYLWVGNDSQEASDSGVTVIDVKTRRVAATIATGKGHHELAISPDDRYAFVSNRDDGTVSVIDIQQLTKITDIPTGPVPVALAFSPLSQALYVADGASGTITVIDGRRHEVVARLETQPGLGPLRFSHDGRWGVVVNTLEDVVYVLDASTNRLAHTIAVGDRPYQIGFSRAFAYVRALGSERVSMINLVELAEGRRPPVVTFPAGAKAPADAADLSIADGIAEAPGEAAVLVVSPADNTVYYYMEGMNAPMGALRNYGQRPRAVGIVDRALREKAPGVYAGEVRIPAAGTYDVAFLLDTPRLLHCFAFEAKPNPRIKVALKPLAVSYLLKQRRVTAGHTVTLRFRLTDPATDQPRTDVRDVRVLYYRAPTHGRTVVRARHVADGVYEAALPLKRAGAYYVYVGAPSLKVHYGDLPYMTLRAVGDKATRGAIKRQKGTEVRP